jgi:AcrR family transcriptional regulator
MADGLRRTSIESIAARSGVSRPTVYAHFASKDEIFRTIVADLHDARLQAMREAAKTDAPVVDRLHGVLAARFVPFVELTTTSAHGAELLDETSRSCGDITRDSHEASLALLLEVLSAADAAGELGLSAVGVDPATAATIVYDAALGAKERPSLTARTYERHLRDLVRVVARGLGADVDPST